LINHLIFSTTQGVLAWQKNYGQNLAKLAVPTFIQHDDISRWIAGLQLWFQNINWFGYIV